MSIETTAKVQHLKKNDRVYLGGNCFRVTKTEPFNHKKKKFVGVKGKLVDNSNVVLGRSGFILPKGTVVRFYSD